MGSIMFSSLLPKVFANKNICEDSLDKNPGAFNVFKNCGVKMGMICLMLDMLKGIIPVYISTRFLDYNNLWFLLVLISPVLGHAIGMFNDFKGGKCISTSFGVLLGIFHITPIVLVLALTYIFFVILFMGKSNYKKSIWTYTFFAIISSLILFYNNLNVIALACIDIAIIAIYKHYYAQSHIITDKEMINDAR